MNDSLLNTIWESLSRVFKVTTHAISHHPQDTWDRKAQGSIRVVKEKDTLRFYETGKWVDTDISYTNCLQWGQKEGCITLEHLRYGELHPVFLFSFEKKDEKTLQSVSNHFCGKDVYRATLVFQPSLSLCVEVTGPNKQQTIQSFYSSI